MKRNVVFHRKRAEAFLSKLSFEEMILIRTGYPEDKKRIGVPYIDFPGEAAHGAQARHDQNFDLGEPVPATTFPTAIGMVSSFDKNLMRQIGRVVGTELRCMLNEHKHFGILGLAPTVDMERDPRWGRNEEGYGEDPRLAAMMGGEYVIGMEGDDPQYIISASTLKHFYANNYENERYYANSEIPNDLKEDYYLRVFKEIIEYSHPLSVMSAYNQVNGVTCTFNPENKELLKKWGVPFIVSDAFTLEYAVTQQHTAKDGADAVRKALDAGVDMFLEKPEFEAQAVVSAFQNGIINEQDIIETLINKLTVYSMLGLLPDDMDEDGCSKLFPMSEYNMSKVDTEESRQLARRSQAESVVLLKNDGMLPLKDKKNIFAFGPFSDYAPMDWYSSVPSYMVTVSEGMAVGSDNLCPKVKLRFKDKNGEMHFAAINNKEIVPADESAAEVFEIMLWDDSRITLKSTTSGKYMSTMSPDIKFVNAEEKAEFFWLYERNEEIFSWFVNEAFILIDDKGETVRFNNDNSLRFWEDSRISGIKNVDGEMEVEFVTVSDVDSALENAILDNNLDSETNILACFGLHPLVNCREDRDRDSIELPPFQRAVLRILRERFNNIAFLIMANGPVAILDEVNDPEVRSILWTAMGCQELGNGLADVIMGRVSPSGRLPQTWYTGDDQLGDIRDYDIRKNKMTYLYMEDKPLYRFGFGLTYSKFECELVSVKDSDSFVGNEFEVTVNNIGDVTSDYVVQIYQSKDGEFYLYGDNEDGLDVNGRKIPIESKLVAFERVHDIKPGERVNISF